MDKLPLAALFLVIIFTACHEHPQMGKTPFSHFRQEKKPILLSIETDWKQLLLHTDTPTYQPAVLTLKKGKGKKEHFHVKVKPRGVYRKQMCEFPPIKIRFPEEVMEKKELSGKSSLKLVSHCGLDSTYEQLVLKEHLVFQLYNVLTDSSFNTQLAKIEYIDSKGALPKYERFGFLIEHADELAERMNGRILGEEFGVPNHIHKPQYKLFTLFQFMVGNTDWALKNRHNVKLVEPLEGKPKIPIPVPYDFDFCGLVNAPYAVPHHSIPVADVRERFFQWKGKGNEDFSAEAAVFLSKKDELLAVVEKCEYLNEPTRSECLAYLDEFFSILESEGENRKEKFLVGE